jgi:hypothetical protein
MTADRAAWHGLIEHDPVPGWFGPGEQVLRVEAQSHGPFGEIFRGGGKQAAVMARM